MTPPHQMTNEELGRQIEVDPTLLSDVDAEWFDREIQWIKWARAILDQVLAQMSDPWWSLTGDRYEPWNRPS